jgi:phage gp36-like protein
MAYCTQDDLEHALPEGNLIALTDDEGAGTVDADRAAEAVASADAEIDGYCAVRYAVPFTTAPALIKKCSVDIAIYNLYSRTMETIPETRAARYKDALRILERIAAGIIELPSDAEASGDTGGVSSISAGDRLFTRAGLEGF